VRLYAADLHVHTALSPCASDDMTPAAIVRAARSRCLAMIAVCDHNSAANASAVQEAAGDSLAVIAGMEITTSEEVHLVGLFPDVSSARSAAAEVLETLPDAEGADKRFGVQLIMDPAGRVLGTEPRMLSAASGFSLADAVALVKSLGGLAVAAHVNRPAFSVTGQLGFVPPGLGLDALEFYGGAPMSPRPPGLPELPVLVSSDAHFLQDVGRHSTVLEMADATFEELKLAVKGLEGRSCSGA